MRERELLGAGVGAQAAGRKGFVDALIRGDAAQIVAQRFPFVGEAELDEFQKLRLISDPQRLAFTRERHVHQSGRHFWRRPKGAGRNLQCERGLRVELAGGGKVSVLAAAGASHDSSGDFQLHHDVNRGDLVCITEKLMKNRRGDVVGEIAVHAKFAAGQFCEIELENIARDDFNAGPFVWFGAHSLFEARGEPRIGFDGNQAAAPGGKLAGHFAVTRADLDPKVICAAGQRVENPFLPARSAKEMLAQALSRHKESECNNADLGAEAVTNSVCFPEIGLTDAQGVRYRFYSG